MRWLIAIGAAIIALAATAGVMMLFPFMKGKSAFMGILRLAIAAGVMAAAVSYVIRNYDQFVDRARTLEVRTHDLQTDWSTTGNVCKWAVLSLSIYMCTLFVGVTLLRAQMPVIVTVLSVQAIFVQRIVSFVTPEKWYGPTSWLLRGSVLLTMSIVALAAGFVTQIAMAR